MAGKSTSDLSSIEVEVLEMLEYLKEFYEEEIVHIINNSDLAYFSLNLNLSHLQGKKPQLYRDVLINLWSQSKKWNSALLEAQKQFTEENAFLDPGFEIKKNCYVRFVNLPLENGNRGVFPNNDHVGMFVQVKGSVVRMTQGKLLEFKKEYYCAKCKQTFTLEAEYSKIYIFDIPNRCPNFSSGCKGTLQEKNGNPNTEYCMDYQELRIQEIFSDKSVPASIVVTLDHDLVDACQPGDIVTVCGTIERRWKPFSAGRRSEVYITLRAISLTKDGSNVNVCKDLSEQIICCQAQWQDTVELNGVLHARDELISSICPEVHGMSLVKLALALSLSSCIDDDSGSSSGTRGHSHLLLVGDPGLAKSKLLKSASQISLRSVHTTGMGCSAAGLTAAAVKEDSEWQLEPGALVLADSGVCCIDEFNLMRGTDKASIHEAMEQQTISMAKAGIVCKLSTRCVVIAATNPKKRGQMSEVNEICGFDIGIGSPLLSRFDIILILRDEHDSNWDSFICDHILKNTNSNHSFKNAWGIQRLRSHFLAIHNSNPALTSEAHIVLGAYYKHCRCDKSRDTSRTTVRFLESLNRLTQAHARLTLRNEANIIDAMAVIRLMEASWGFGRLVESINLLKQDLPLGPDAAQIDVILNALHLQSLKEKALEELKDLTKTFRKNNEEYKRNEKESTSAVEPEGDNDENKSIRKTHVVTVKNLETLFGYQPNAKRLKPNEEANDKQDPCNADHSKRLKANDDSEENLFGTDSDDDVIASLHPAAHSINHLNALLNCNLTGENQSVNQPRKSTTENMKPATNIQDSNKENISQTDHQNVVEEFDFETDMILSQFNFDS